ncbi:hypothetical protein CC2G_008998 [Coprinopsis cinerea AmutBmut pab1-1]|nr:hypothetical protein CC2G_008998 [Coprinopsis cinerea AmutBmut pab1-1]
MIIQSTGPYSAAYKDSYANTSWASSHPTKSHTSLPVLRKKANTASNAQLLEKKWFTRRNKLTYTGTGVERRDFVWG